MFIRRCTLCVQASKSKNMLWCSAVYHSINFARLFFLGRFSNAFPRTYCGHSQISVNFHSITVTIAFCQCKHSICMHAVRSCCRLRIIFHSSKAIFAHLDLLHAAEVAIGKMVLSFCDALIAASDIQWIASFIFGRSGTSVMIALTNNTLRYITWLLLLPT